MKGKMFNYWTEGGFITLAEESEPNKGKIPLQLLMDGREKVSYDRKDFDLSYIMSGGKIAAEIVTSANARRQSINANDYVKIGQWMGEQLKKFKVWLVLIHASVYNDPEKKNPYHAIKGLEYNRNWPIIFFDNEQKLFVDYSTSTGKELFDGIENGKTIFPDDFHKSLIIGRNYLLYGSTIESKKKGLDFLIKAANLNPSPAPMMEILISSRFPELRPCIDDFCKNYLERFEKNKDNYTNQDGSRLKVEAARLANLYLEKKAQENNTNLEVREQEKQKYFVTIRKKQYEVSGDIFTGKKEGRIFKDEKGDVVRDLDLAKKIAQTAWVYENIVKAPGVPNSQRVSAILETHKSLRQYELAQDILARMSVQIIATTISGGATLIYTVPAGLTWRVVRDQFANLKGLLSLTGRQGLEETLSKYQQMESLITKLKPNHIDDVNAAEIKKLYESAYGLDLPYSALLTSLMPKKGCKLVDKALKDVGDELIKTLPLSDATLTTREVFELQGKMDDALKTNPVLKKYYEKLDLAKRLKDANEQIISAWAEHAVQYKE